MKGPDLVGMEDIPEVLEISNSATLKEIVDPIRRAMNLFEKNISTMAFLPDVSRITLRIASLQSILSKFREEIKGKQFEQILEKAGEEIGESFACDLINFLIKHNKIAKSEKVLIKLGAEFDEMAGWGKFDVNHEGDKIIVEVKNSFLTRELEEDKHRYCSLMLGYIKGSLWNILKEHYRLFGKLIVKPSITPKTVYKVTADCGRETCRFIVHLKEEQLQNAFDSFYASKSKLKENQLDDAARLLRTSVEMAFKEKLGMNKDDKTSVLNIMATFKEKNIPLKYNLISDIYASTSSVVHGSKEHSKEKLAGLQSKWNDVLKELELLELE